MIRRTSPADRAAAVEAPEPAPLDEPIPVTTRAGSAVAPSSSSSPPLEAPPAEAPLAEPADAAPREEAATETPGPAEPSVEAAPRPALSDAPAYPSVPAPTPSARERSMLADPTQRPPDAAPSSSESPLPSVAARSRPLLASEALMEDLAPVEPARRDARLWCGACGFSFLFFGCLPLVALLPGGLGAAIPWLVTGAIALVAGFSSVAYRQRAVAMIVLGLLTGLVALQGSSTLVRADGGAIWGAARIVSVVSLTAALVFRARYRAYAGARIFLGVAQALSVPFVIHAVFALAADAPFGAAQVGAALVLLAMAATLVGFMGAETTGAGPYVAFALVAACSVELAARGVAMVGVGAPLPMLLAVFVGAAGFGAAAGFTALGLFQIAAWRFAADARRIDLHVPPRDRTPPSEREPASEWSTRE